MFRPRRIARKRKAVRRRVARRSAPRKNLTQSKVYKYNFSPTTQYLRNVEGVTPGSGGAYALAPLPSVVGASPLAIGTNYTVQPYPASSGLSFCYDFGVAMNFQAFHVQNIGNWSTLYDQYRIDSVTVNIRYLKSQPFANGASGEVVAPTIYAIVDQDDSIIPLSNIELARQGRRIFRFDNKSKTNFKITINRPKRAAPVNLPAGTGTSQQIIPNGWCDMAGLKVAHYGLKLWVENMSCPNPTALQTAFEFTYQYRMSFKGNRNQY